MSLSLALDSSHIHHQNRHMSFLGKTAPSLRFSRQQRHNGAIAVASLECWRHLTRFTLWTPQHACPRAEAARQTPHTAPLCHKELQKTCPPHGCGGLQLSSCTWERGRRGSSSEGERGTALQNPELPGWAQRVSSCSPSSQTIKTTRPEGELSSGRKFLLYQSLLQDRRHASQAGS